MQRQPIAAHFKDADESCASCTQRRAMNEGFSSLKDQLSGYSIALLDWMLLHANHLSSLAPYLRRLHTELEAFLELFRDSVENHRVADGVLFDQYFIVNQYGQGGNAMKTGVIAHGQYWDLAHSSMETSEAQFARLQEAHAALAQAYSRCSCVNTDDDFLRTGFQPVETSMQSVHGLVRAFWATLQPWLDERRKVTFRIELPAFSTE